MASEDDPGGGTGEVQPTAPGDVDDRPSARADLFWSLGWMVVGAAIFAGGYRMDRLEAQHINPYTAPGLVPALLGVGLMLLGALLFARSYAHRVSHARPRGAGAGADLGRLAAALVLCIGYGAGLVGRGLPFWLSTFFFVFVSISAFEWREHKARGEVGRGLAIATACAAATAALVTLVFQEVFLVRLP